MKVYKTLYWITIIAGLTIFSIGVYLKFANQSSGGLTAGRFGDIHHGMLTSFSGMFLGILILLLSIWVYRIYKEDKQKFDKTTTTTFQYRETGTNPHLLVTLNLLLSYCVFA